MITKNNSDHEAVTKALKLIDGCITDSGFIASPTINDNYRRIWARDGVIIGLSALMSNIPELVETFKRTLQTLADHQGPYGEIPSNVSTEKERVSYGGTAGRVDASLWFAIGLGEYCTVTGDCQFAERMLPTLEKVIFLLGAWQFNNRGFIYVPATGDWADEYIQSGYVLYDQLLYLQALKSYRALKRLCSSHEDADLSEDIHRLSLMIRDNFWFGSSDEVPENVYHKILFEKGRKAADRCTQRFWLPFFSPHGYGYRFDCFANILASLFNIASDKRKQIVDDYIQNEIVGHKPYLLPAFHPVIKPVDSDWEELKVTFSYDFKNSPYEFHNGGLWPMLTGFYVVDLVHKKKKSLALRFQEGINWANSMEMEGSTWGFPEYINGQDHTPGGNIAQGWSASAAIMGHYALLGKKVFSINE